MIKYGEILYSRHTSADKCSSYTSSTKIVSINFHGADVREVTDFGYGSEGRGLESRWES